MTAEMADKVVLVLIVDYNLVLTFLLLGAAFHISTALLMGLNSFVFSFTATYPPIIYLHKWLQT